MAKPPLNYHAYAIDAARHHHVHIFRKPPTCPDLARHSYLVRPFDVEILYQSTSGVSHPTFLPCELVFFLPSRVYSAGILLFFVDQGGLHAVKCRPQTTTRWKILPCGKVTWREVIKSTAFETHDIRIVIDIITPRHASPRGI